MSTDLVIILSSDWVGSTQARAQLGEDTADAVQEVHDTLLRRVIAAEDGTVVKHYGDGVLATFKSATAALAAAARIQVDFAAYRGSPDALTRLDVRVGLSAGDIKHQAGDIFGLPVVEAVRLQGAAGPNEILCSDLVRVLSQGRGGFEFEAAGVLEFKGLPAPVHALKVRRPEPGVITATAAPRSTPPLPAANSRSPVAHGSRRLGIYALASLLTVAVVALLADRFLREDTSVVNPDPIARAAPPVAADPAEAKQPSPLPNSVAVLPFENMSPDPNNAYFADGLHEEVLNQLAKIKALNVIARTTMRQYANTDKSLRQVAEELNVETVMEGSVRYADNNNIRVTAQLINPATDVHLWSEAYDREQKDIFAVQTDIALKVAEALAANFSLAEREAIERVPTQSPAAYALYLEARVLFNRSTLNDVASAIEKINQALALDPDFALGWTFKARLHSIAWIFFPERLAQEQIEQEQAAQRALEIDPDLPEAHYEASSFALRRGDWLLAQAEMDKAIALGGSDEPSLYATVGHIEKALQAAIESQKRDPLNPQVSVYLMTSYCSLGDTQAMLREYARSKALFPDTPFGYANIAALCLLGHGDGEQAREIVRNDLTLGSLYTTVLSDTLTVEQSLFELHRLYAGDGFTQPLLRIRIAALAAFLGDQQLAMRAIKESLDESAIPGIMIWQPVFRAVRQLDEFKDYLREKGFVAYWRQYGWPDLCQPVGADDFECS